MITAPDTELDLTISRIIRAPRRVVWNAWTDPASFEQWWIPAYAAHVMHKSNADRAMHETLGFHDGWGTVADQLAALAERRV